MVNVCIHVDGEFIIEQNYSEEEWSKVEWVTAVQNLIGTYIGSPPESGKNMRNITPYIV